MTATILLIRHAAHAHVGSVLSGRTPGLGLSEDGRRQAERLARALGPQPLELVQSSPIQRAAETAAAIVAGRPSQAVETVPALDEIDFGEWSGRTFDALARDPRWEVWNNARNTAVAPSGESMADAQSRAWTHVQRTAATHAGATVAMVTHCDVIRAVVAQVLDLPLDSVLRFEVDPASISRLAVGSWGCKLLSLNERP